MNEYIPPANGDPGDAPESAFLQDDKGYYKLITRKREIPRKTYLSGSIRGKYQGKIAKDLNGPYERTTFYDFHIYEAEVDILASSTCSCITISKQTCNGLHTEIEGSFDRAEERIYASGNLPRQLPVTVTIADKQYATHVYEPLLAHVQFPSRLHHTEDEEVFGTIEADITGFLLDFIETECTERVYFKETIEGEVPVEVITRQLIQQLFPQAR